MKSIAQSAWFLLLFTPVCIAETPVTIQAPLPPEIPWTGASEALIVSKSDPWVTPAEATDLRESPSYDETVTWLRRLVAAAPQLKMLSIGTSPEGRKLWIVVASKDGAGDPSALRANGRPTLFAQAGIHSGEIDGKDAGMMPRVEKRRMLFPVGSVRVSTDQPLGDLAVILLEPSSTDSFYQWGFFLEVLSRVEYAESYVLEPLARKMLDANPSLRREFQQRLDADPDFRSNPKKRLDFFYRRTPYFDDRYLLYPIARELRSPASSSER